jgi:hypothetical protein
MRKFSKREFIGSLSSFSVFFFLAPVKAATILEELKSEIPGPLEQELINNPRKQILLAETPGCFTCTPGSWKMKCESTQACDGK